MQFERSAAEQQFRREVQTFLATHLSPDTARRVSMGYHQRETDLRDWTRVLHRQGWSAPRWPKEYGGADWSPLQQLIFDEEAFLAGAPALSTLGVSLVGPVIYTFGSAAQKRRYLPGILSGEELWGQGFSEPRAGSDLASLTTRAVRDGDDYVINGMKTWSSEAHWAQQIFLLARTDPTVKPQAGISFLLVPADAPGLAIRPVLDIGGGHSLNEMHFENVRTPVTNRVGEEGMGWTYAKFLLERERAFSSEVPRNRKNLERLRRLLHRERGGGQPLIDDPSFALRFAQLQIDLDALTYLTLGALSNDCVSPEGLRMESVLKIRGTELIQRIGEVTMDALGHTAAEYFAEPDSPNDVVGELEHAYGIASEFFYRRAVTIYGGSNEIQRNLIAKHVLGL